MPRFSVLIPTRNRPEYLPEAIDSVLKQSFADFELLLINDGDQPLRAPDDKRIRVLDNHSRGAVPARNLGVREARGRYVAFLDDDDFWIDDFHLACAEEALGNAANFYFADGIMPFPAESKPRLFARDADAFSLEHDNTILISAVCYARQLHDSLGWFDETLPYYWDWDWYLRVARAGYTLHRHIVPAVNIRIHPANMSGQTNAAARHDNLDRFARKHCIGPLVLKNHGDFSIA